MSYLPFFSKKMPKSSRVSIGEKTNVHGLGDGAKWIEDQMKRIFGNQVNYLVDFYHTSECLAKAAEHGWTSEKDKWLKEQQGLLKITSTRKF